MPPDETDEERLEKLEEDGSRPAAPADDTADAADDTTAPVSDTDTDQAEIYDQGGYGSSGFSEPHDNGGTVTGYDPTKDRRRQ